MKKLVIAGGGGVLTPDTWKGGAIIFDNAGGIILQDSKHSVEFLPNEFDLAVEMAVDVFLKEKGDLIRFTEHYGRDLEDRFERWGKFNPDTMLMIRGVDVLRTQLYRSFNHTSRDFAEFADDIDL